MDSLGMIERRYLDQRRVIDDGARIADQLLTIAIRALDYTPPIHLTFGDYLSAMLTADAEIHRNDEPFGLRKTLRQWFGKYGIHPASAEPDGKWQRSQLHLVHRGVRFGGLQSDPTEMFRLIWENRQKLQFDVKEYSRVSSVRPCVRLGAEDGLPIHETVAECITHIRIAASELCNYNLKRPSDMPSDQQIVLEGGSTLIFDEYGRIKFEIHNGLPRPRDSESVSAWQNRLTYLWEQGWYDHDGQAALATRLSEVHRRRVLDAGTLERREVW
jgi:hypothetical protein